MSDIATEHCLHYHLWLDPQEVSITEQALRLLISDEAHEAQIRRLAREVLELLEGQPGSVHTLAEPVTYDDTQTSGSLTHVLEVPLTALQMKITHTAVGLLLDDTQREQEPQRRLLWNILDKLPDEHVMRAIELL
ncbi:MAG TPA: hypothetical protein VID48_07380 [Solirubrobacteraceae bacterium]|jgi:ATP-dependent Lon protease